MGWMYYNNQLVKFKEISLWTIIRTRDWKGKLIEKKWNKTIAEPSKPERIKRRNDYKRSLFKINKARYDFTEKKYLNIFDQALNELPKQNEN